MNRPPLDRTDDRTAKHVCGRRRKCALDATEEGQPFPTQGELFDNLDLPKAELERRIGRLPGMVRFYSMRDIREDQFGLLQQIGSGPNFQADWLTLCTCRPDLRAEERWTAAGQEWWIAGFTNTTLPSLRHHSRSLIHWLFYLAKVQVAYASQAELWRALADHVRLAKSTRLHQLGDLYEPNPTSPCTDPWDADHYYPPMVGHNHRPTQAATIWRDYDIERTPYGRHPRLLLATRKLTFLWRTPLLYKDYRRQGTWESVCECLSELTPAE
jgi:hypothetical protein